MANPTSETKKPGEQPAVAKAADKPAAKPAAQAGSKAPSTEELAGVDRFMKGLIGPRYKGGAKPPEGETPKGEGAGDKKPEDEKPKDEKPEGGKKTHEKGPDGKFLPGKDKGAPKAPFKPKPQPGADTSQIPTASEIAAAAAEGATRAIIASRDGERKADKKAEEPEYSPAEKRKRDVLSRMEQLYPDQYKDLIKRYDESNQKWRAYAEDWKKEHPGQPFDEDSPEHSDFLEENDIGWEESDFAIAAADMRAEERSREGTGKLNEKLSELERNEQIRQAGHEIFQEQNVAAASYWQTLGDEFKGIVSPDGKIDNERLQTLSAQNPEGFKILLGTAEYLDKEVAEIYKIMTWPELHKPKENEMHRVISQFAYDKEQEMMRLPVQERMFEGKVFLPAGQYYSRNITAEERRERYWTFTKRDVAAMRASHLANVANARVIAEDEKFRRTAAARGINLDNPNEKPESPSIGVESRSAAVAAPDQKGGDGPGSGFLKKFIART